MKLKTEFQDEDFRKGEVADVSIGTTPDGRIVARATAKSGGKHTFYYDCFKTLCNDWSDYEEPEEPEEYWFIENDGHISSIRTDEDFAESLRASRDLGNYFLSQEEAEKAVERLRAWKRLKDKGFRFNKWEAECMSGKGTISTNFNLWEGLEEEVVEDLDLLFSGGEE